LQIQVQEVNKRVDRKIEKVEENILQWIDEEAKAIRQGFQHETSHRVSKNFFFLQTCQFPNFLSS
jgi:G:T/U-mismatch repair DNA glycosylase